MSRKKKNKQDMQTYELNEYAANKVTELLGDMFDVVCREIDDEFLEREDELRTFFSVLIGTRYFCEGKPLPHYKWVYDGCPYDCSGELKAAGNMAADISLGDFLEEYTGNKRATHISGMGWKYLQYNDVLAYDLLEVGEAVMWSVIKRHVDSKLLEGDSEWFFRDEIHDSFYDNTLTSSFFCIECVDGEGGSVLSIFDYDMPLQDYLKIGKPYWKAFQNKLDHCIKMGNGRYVSIEEQYEIFKSLPRLI